MKLLVFCVSENHVNKVITLKVFSKLYLIMACSINKHGETLSNISVASGLYFFENDLISAIIPIRDVFRTLSNTSDRTFCENN